MRVAPLSKAKVQIPFKKPVIQAGAEYRITVFKKKEKIKKELPPGTIRKEFHFEGNVQNIGFRFEVQSHSKPLGITGYAKNNEDGSVTAQLQGSLKNIDKVILSLQNIDRIQIDSITEKEIPLDYYENDFYILY